MRSSFLIEEKIRDWDWVWPGTALAPKIIPSKAEILIKRFLLSLMNKGRSS